MTIRKKRISEECHYAFDFSFFCLNAIGDIPRYFFVNLHRKEELGKSKTDLYISHQKYPYINSKDVHPLHSVA